jgi:hypothetical protein
MWGTGTPLAVKAGAMCKLGVIGPTVATAAAVLFVASSVASANDIVIHMASPEYLPARLMQDLSNERYQAPSGNDVRLQIDFFSWANY